MKPWVPKLLGPYAKFLPRRYHSVAILDVRPRPDERQFEPYFAATCTCGWVRTDDTESDLRLLASGHSDDVAERAERPLG
jgi:hypothetical protein